MDRQIIKNCETLLDNIDKESQEYHLQYMDPLTDFVNESILNRNDINLLISNNEQDIVKNNHKNHAEFMQNIFYLNDGKILYDTYIWAYRSYSKRGFSFNYFYYEMQSWIEGLKKLQLKPLEPIIELYIYLFDLHDHFVSRSLVDKGDPMHHIVDKEIYNGFLEAILLPDLQRALNISKEYIDSREKIKPFWEQVIMPALYSIGDKWSSSKISVGQEHMATSLCQRVMAEHYDKILTDITKDKRLIVITGQKELHQVGALMVSDILELNGYYVNYLGNSSCFEEMVDIIEKENIDYIIISSTLVSNLGSVKEIIEYIKKRFPVSAPVIIVGGQAFMQNEKLKEEMDADHCILTISSLLELLKGDPC